MSWIESVSLGLLQGLTEFLPVSSSGHLALANLLFGVEREHGPAVEVFLHLGTALSIITVYRREVLALLRSSLGLLAPARWGRSWRDDTGFRMVIYLVVSAIPVAVVGLLFEEKIESLFESSVAVGCCLIGTGLILVFATLQKGGDRPVDFRIAMVMGVSQALAILPGISRSGTTISAGLASGGERQGVGQFAFLMALAPICGAAILKAGDLMEDGGADFGIVLLGTLVAYASGIFALKVLLGFVRRGRLAWFAPYCVGAGILAIVLA